MRNELGNWALKDISIQLYAYECLAIYESLEKFLDEFRSRKNDYFSETFTQEIDRYEFTIAYKAFSELINTDTSIEKLKNTKLKERMKNGKKLQ